MQELNVALAKLARQDKTSGSRVNAAAEQARRFFKRDADATVRRLTDYFSEHGPNGYLRALYVLNTALVEEKKKRTKSGKSSASKADGKTSYMAEMFRPRLGRMIEAFRSADQDTKRQVSKVLGRWKKYELFSETELDQWAAKSGCTVGLVDPKADKSKDARSSTGPGGPGSTLPQRLAQGVAPPGGPPGQPYPPNAPPTQYIGYDRDRPAYGQGGPSPGGPPPQQHSSFQVEAPPGQPGGGGGNNGYPGGGQPYHGGAGGGARAPAPQYNHGPSNERGFPHDSRGPVNGGGRDWDRGRDRGGRDYNRDQGRGGFDRGGSGGGGGGGGAPYDRDRDYRDRDRDRYDRDRDGPGGRDRGSGGGYRDRDDRGDFRGPGAARYDDRGPRSGGPPYDRNGRGGSLPPGPPQRGPGGPPGTGLDLGSAQSLLAKVSASKAAAARRPGEEISLGATSRPSPAPAPAAPQPPPPQQQQQQQQQHQQQQQPQQQPYPPRPPGASPAQPPSGPSQPARGVPKSLAGYGNTKPAGAPAPPPPPAAPQAPAASGGWGSVTKAQPAATAQASAPAPAASSGGGGWGKFNKK